MNKILLLSAFVLTIMFTGCGSNKDIKVTKIDLCQDGNCDSLTKESSMDTFAETFYNLLKKNRGEDVTICEADKVTKICTDDSINHYVQGGPIPGLRVIKHFKLGDTVLFDRVKNTIKFNKKHYGDFIGIPTYAPPYSATVSIDANNTVNWKEDFYQSWMVVGQMADHYYMKIDYVNATKGIIGGYYDTGVTGTGIGYGNGYAIMKFPKAMPSGEDWTQRQILAFQELDKAVEKNLEKKLEKFYEGQKTKEGKVDTKAAKKIEELKAQLKKEALEIQKKNEQKRKQEIDDILKNALAKVKEQNSLELEKLRTQIKEQQKHISNIKEKHIKEEALALFKQMKQKEEEQKELLKRKKEKEQREYAKKVKYEFGDYHAIVIGNNDYTKLDVLNTAVDDAIAIGNILEQEYGFKVKKLINANRATIVSTLSQYRKMLKPNDNLLIYYAGHGWLDKDADEGYWLPIDADKEDTVNWISNSTITSAVRAYKAKHVMVIADSCYSGKLSRSLKLQTPKNIVSEHLMKMASIKARVVLTSGDLEPVADDGGKGNHSLFNSEVTKALKENQTVITASQLFDKIQRPMMVNSDQKPRYSDIKKAGHDGGDFIFVKTLN